MNYCMSKLMKQVIIWFEHTELKENHVLNLSSCSGFMESLLMSIFPFSFIA